MAPEPLTLDTLLKFIGLASAITGGLLFVFRLGAKLDRLSTAIEHLTNTLTDHETRIRELERSDG